MAGTKERHRVTSPVATYREGKLVHLVGIKTPADLRVDSRIVEISVCTLISCNVFIMSLSHCRNMVRWGHFTMYHARSSLGIACLGREFFMLTVQANAAL